MINVTEISSNKTYRDKNNLKYKLETGRNRHYLWKVTELSENESKILPQKELVHGGGTLSFWFCNILSFVFVPQVFCLAFSFTCFAYLLYQ